MKDISVAAGAAPRSSKFSHPLGLRRTEWNVIRGAHWALSRVSNGHFLAGTTVAIKNAVDSLVTRGFITRVPNGSTPPVDWPVVKLEVDNIEAYNAALAKAAAGSAEVAEQGRSVIAEHANNLKEE